MKFKDIEKKIYEFLGVNIFRKKILMNIEKILVKLKLPEDPSYHVKKNTIDELENFKKLSKRNAKIHIFASIIWLTECFILKIVPLWYGSFCLLIDFYSIMTQRYNHIRVNELLEKHQKLKRIEEEKIKNDKEQENGEAHLSNTKSAIISPKVKLKKQEETSSSIEEYYWEAYLKSLEQKDLNIGIGFQKVKK